MKINFIKSHGGVLLPASDIEVGRMYRFKNGDMYEIDIKLKRNGSFHKKVFAFTNHCFQYWCANNTEVEFQCEKAQFDYFRKSLLIKAGYYDYVVDINGSTMVQARSMSYDSMEQEEFEQVYSAMINAAIATIFQGASDEECQRLHSFF